jgi:hypothetical protein
VEGEQTSSRRPFSSVLFCCLLLFSQSTSTKSKAEAKDIHNTELNQNEEKYTEKIIIIIIITITRIKKASTNETAQQYL